MTEAPVDHRLPRTGHVGLNVADLGRSRRFYEAAFGFRPVLESDEPERRFVFLGDGDHLVLTLWQQSEGRFDRARPGLHHLSFQVGSVEEVRDYERRLRELGATFLHDGVVAHAEGAASGESSLKILTASVSKSSPPPGWPGSWRQAATRPPAASSNGAGNESNKGFSLPRG